MSAPLHEPWTPERVIEAQGKVIERQRQRIKNLQRWNKVLVKRAGERGFRLEALQCLAGSLVDDINVTYGEVSDAAEHTPRPEEGREHA